MVDLVEAAKTSPKHKGGTCWAQKMPDDIAEQLTDIEAMVDAGEEVNYASLRRALVDEGYQIGRTSVSRHFRHECSCGR